MSEKHLIGHPRYIQTRWYISESEPIIDTAEYVTVLDNMNQQDALNYFHRDQGQKLIKNKIKGRKKDNRIIIDGVRKKIMKQGRRLKRRLLIKRIMKRH